jgi:uncharacterized membrane protein
MDPFIADWLNLLVRWGHLVAGIAWIGTSFYFVALDFSLRKVQGLPPGVYGEAWEVHGGGFYHVQKYLSAPLNLPDQLIWFKWEAYLTWVTGFLLIILQYYVGASSYLIDPQVMALAPWEAIGISLAGLLGGWLAYHWLCKSPIGRHTGILAISVFLLILAAAWGFSHVFSGRGAFIHIGAFVGTMMAANVFMVIIPNQKKITAALLRGEKPDPIYGVIGKQRSLHNTYLTLPVLFMMVSNHYPMVTNHPQAWILAGLFVLGGAYTRHFLLRHEVGDDINEIAWAVPIIAACLAAALMLTQPERTLGSGPAITDEQAMAIITARCVPCHSASPTDPTTKEAPKGIVLDTIEDLRRFAPQVAVQAVQNRAMPLGNKTEMTIEERQQLGAWIAAQ